MTILWSVGPAPWFHQQGHIHDRFFKYVLHVPLVGCWILCIEMCSVDLIFYVCGPGLHSGSNQPSCGIYHPPLSSAEVKESVELYSPCRPWMPVVGWNLFFTFLFFIFFICLGQGSVVHVVTVLLAGWSWVQILVGTKDFSLLQYIQTSSGANPAFYIRVPRLFPGIKAARTWS